MRKTRIEQLLSPEQAEELQHGLEEFADYIETCRASTPDVLTVEYMREMFEAYLEHAGCFSSRRTNAPLAVAASRALERMERKRQ